MQQLSHPCFDNMLDLQVYKATLFFEVYKYHKGGNLMTYLQQQPAPLDEETILEIFAQIVLCVENIHSMHAVHKKL